MKRVVVIGGGISGASVARVLSRYSNLEVHVVERESDVGWGVSKANTAIIHGGYDDDPKKYPVRARLCVKGNRIWHEWVKELDIPHVWNGALVVAMSDDDVRGIKNLLRRGIKNGVPEMRMINGDELFSMEPGLNRNAVAALWVPTVGQIDPVRAVIALIENAVMNGVKVHLETEVRRIVVESGAVRGVETNTGFLRADVVVNAAGLYADSVAASAGVHDIRIRPRKGEYYVFDDDSQCPRHVLFPTPTKVSKGIVVTTEISGHLMIGPNAQDLPPDEKEETGTTEVGLREVWEGAKRLWPNLPPRGKVIRTFAGLRPEPDGGDFIVRAEEVWGLIEVAGIRSPGLTSAPAIAWEVVDILNRDLGLELNERDDWNPYRRGIPNLFTSGMRSGKLEAADPSHRKVICRCNMVSEGEILEAIRRMRMIGVKTPSIDSVKFRTKATTGTCQGSFCRPLIMEILAREYGVNPWEVTLKGRGSELGVGDVKSLIKGQTSYGGE